MAASLVSFESYNYDDELFSMDGTLSLEASVALDDDRPQLTATTDAVWWVTKQGVYRGNLKGQELVYGFEGTTMSIVALDDVVAACSGTEAVVFVDPLFQISASRVVAVGAKGAVCFMDASHRLGVASPTTEPQIVDDLHSDVWFEAQWRDGAFDVVGFDKTDDFRVLHAWIVPLMGPPRLAVTPRGQHLIRRCIGESIFLTDGDHAVTMDNNSVVPAMWRVISARDDARVCTFGGKTPAFAVASAKHGLAVFEVSGPVHGATLTKPLPSDPVAVAAVPTATRDRRPFAVLTTNSIIFASLRPSRPVVVYSTTAVSSTSRDDDDDDVPEDIRHRLRALDAMEALSDRTDW